MLGGSSCRTCACPWPQTFNLQVLVCPSTRHLSCKVPYVAYQNHIVMIACQFHADMDTRVASYLLHFSDNRRTMADLSIYEARLSGFEQDQVVPKLMKFAKAAVKFDIPKMLPELVAQVRRCFWADCYYSYYTWHSSKNLCPNAC